MEVQGLLVTVAMTEGGTAGFEAAAPWWRYGHKGPVGWWSLWPPCDFVTRRGTR